MVCVCRCRSSPITFLCPRFEFTFQASILLISLLQARLLRYKSDMDLLCLRWRRRCHIVTADALFSLSSYSTFHRNLRSLLLQIKSNQIKWFIRYSSTNAGLQQYRGNVFTTKKLVVINLELRCADWCQFAFKHFSVISLKKKQLNRAR